jgi:hypothetical protein
MQVGAAEGIGKKVARWGGGEKSGNVARTRPQGQEQENEEEQDQEED